MKEVNSKNCLNCAKEFFKTKISSKQWDLKEYCSRNCYYDYAKKHNLKKGSNSPTYKGGKISTNCFSCNKVFLRWNYENNRKCCSKYCDLIYRKSSDFKLKISHANKGKTLTEEHKKQISEFHKGRWVGEKNAHWKGNDVGYRGLHGWVIKVKGTPTICEHCGLDSVK